MFELIWGILNVILLIGLIIFLIKIVKIVRREIGWGAAAVVSLAFIMAFSPSNDKKSDSKFPLSEVYEIVHEDTKFQRIELTNNGINKTFVHLNFSNNNELLNAELNRTGLVAFTSVSPNLFVWDKIGENKIKYSVNYYKNWYLLGIKIYTQNFNDQMTNHIEI